MILTNNKIINIVAYGATSPAYPIGGIQQQHSCKLLTSESFMDNMANGSITASQNITYNMKCWKCHNEFQVKGLRYDEECPKCGYRTNNPEFPKTLHSLAHFNHTSKFLSIPIPDAKNFTHDNIYGNTARVAQGSGRSIHKNLFPKRIQQLNRLLSFTRGGF